MMVVDTIASWSGDVSDPQQPREQNRWLWGKGSSGQGGAPNIPQLTGTPVFSKGLWLTGLGRADKRFGRQAEVRVVEGL